MIPSLFVFRFRQGLRWLIPAAAFSFLLGILAVFSYTLGLPAAIDSLKTELPGLLTLLGYLGSANLGVHIMGILYGFVLPMLVILLSVSLAQRLIAKPLQDGRMATLLASEHRRSSIILTLCLVMLLNLALILLFCLAGQAVSTFFLFPGFDFSSILRINIGFILVSLPFPAFAAFIACITATARRARRLTLILMLTSVGFMAASRLSGWPSTLRFLTPFSLFEGQRLLGGAGGWSLALWALPLTLVFLLATAWVFRSREL